MTESYKMINKVNQDNTPEEYKGKIGRGVRVSLANGNTGRIGVFHSYDDFHIYLKPCLVEEGLYNQNKEAISFARIETKTSVSIRRDLIGIIEPLSEGYLEKLAGSLNQEKNNIILSR